MSFYYGHFKLRAAVSLQSKMKNMFTRANKKKLQVECLLLPFRRFHSVICLCRQQLTWSTDEVNKVVRMTFKVLQIEI